MLIVLIFVIRIILFFTILLAIKKTFEEVLNYYKRDITIEINLEELSKYKK